MSLFLYLSVTALHNRIPSIIDAWFKESDIITSLSFKIVSNKPAFASKHDV